MKVVIIFTITLFSFLLGYGQTHTVVCQNNNSIVSTHKEFFFTGMQIEKQIRLKWSTIKNENVDYFIIEKSSDNIFWEFVDCIEGINDNDTIIEYMYEDYNILNYFNFDVIYYRIVQTNFEGNYIEFNPISVKLSPSVSYVLNSNNKEISIYTYDYLGELLTISNIFGERIVSEKITKEITSLDLSNHNGVHIIQINGFYLDIIIL